MAAVDCFFKEVRDNQEEGAGQADKDATNYNNDALLIAVLKYFEKECYNESTHWPEFLRIILKSKRYSFGHLSPKM